MPTYEYLCQKCGHVYEKREGFDALPRQRCPKCRGVSQRVLYAPPIVFKGSGFYVTDSRKSESGRDGGESASGKGRNSESNGSARESASASSEGKSRKSESGGSEGESTSGASDSKPEKSEKKDSGSASTEAAAAS